jgi:membrane-bound serine protease (ClpP class)
MGPSYFNVHASWWVIALLMLANLSFSIFTYIMGIRALRKLPTGGTAGIIGCQGIVITPLNPTGYVKVRGELWKASSAIPLASGDTITVTSIDGLMITVIRDNKI